MNKIISLILGAFFLTACGQNYTVVDEETLNTNPELEGVVSAWQNLVDAGTDENCDAVLEQMRSSLNMTEESCPDAFEYLKTAPEVDWSKTDWNESAGKAKIYKMNGGSITSFILDTSDDTWRADSFFWQD